MGELIVFLGMKRRQLFDGFAGGEDILLMLYKGLQGR